jgi:hypothetical protein
MDQLINELSSGPRDVLLGRQLMVMVLANDECDLSKTAVGHEVSRPTISGIESAIEPYLNSDIAIRYDGERSVRVGEIHSQWFLAQSRNSGMHSSLYQVDVHVGWRTDHDSVNTFQKLL